MNADMRDAPTVEIDPAAIGVQVKAACPTCLSDADVIGEHHARASQCWRSCWMTDATKAEHVAFHCACGREWTTKI